MRTGLVIAGIVLLAAAFRLSWLGSLPPGLHPDEAANVVEARALLDGGRSSDGRAWPLVFPHHGVDWVEGPYVWLSVPAVAVAGPHVEVGARLVAALAGTLAVLATFALGRRVGGPRVGLVAAALLAVEPWAIHHSRFGDRAALEPLLLASGLALALSGLASGRPRRALAGGVVLSLALLSYAPARAVVPLVALSATLGTKAPWRLRALVLAPIALAFFGILPFALSERGLVRLRSIAQTDPFEVGRGYVLHFTTRTLFSGAVAQGFLAKGTPPLLACEGPFIVLGGVAAARSPRWRWLLGWLVAYPLAGALTQPAPNLLRAIFGLPLFALLGALGLEVLLERLAQKQAAARRIVGAVLVALFATAAAHALGRYVLVFPGQPSAWSPYAEERERVAAMRGRVELRLPFERACVEAYARGRPHRWIDDHEVVFPDE